MPSEPQRSRRMSHRRRSPPVLLAASWLRLPASGGRREGDGRLSERSLLMGTIDAPQPLKSARAWKWSISTVALALIAVLLIVGATTGAIDRVGAFFGAGSALLASLCAAAWWLRHRARSGIYGHGWLSVSMLGMRTATYRPGRSVLSIAVIAAATFILISVEAFRRGDQLTDTGRDRVSVATTC